MISYAKPAGMKVNAKEAIVLPDFNKIFYHSHPSPN